MCLATPRITLLGTKWKREDLSIPLARYSGLYHLKKPTSIKEVSYIKDIYAIYRHIIPDFEELSKPIYNLLNATTFVWLDIHEATVDNLRSALIKQAMSYVPDPSKPLYLETYASYVAIGTTLSQYNNNNSKQLITACSISFNRSERSHSAVIK